MPQTKVAVRAGVPNLGSFLFAHPSHARRLDPESIHTMISMKAILAVAFGGVCYAAPPDQINESLDSGEKTERMQAIAKLNEAIDNSKLSNEARLEAIQLAVDMNVHECGGIIIKYIDTYWVRKKSAMSPESAYPSVEAIISLGEKAVPGLIEALKKEEDELRHRLMSYSIGRIMKQDAALAYLDKVLVADLPAAERKRLEAAKAEIRKWSDYPWDTGEVRFDEQ